MKGMLGVSWNSLQGQSGVKEKEMVEMVVIVDIKIIPYKI